MMDVTRTVILGGRAHLGRERFHGRCRHHSGHRSSSISRDRHHWRCCHNRHDQSDELQRCIDLGERRGYDLDRYRDRIHHRHSRARMLRHIVMGGDHQDDIPYQPQSHQRGW